MQGGSCTVSPVLAESTAAWMWAGEQLVAGMIAGKALELKRLRRGAVSARDKNEDSRSVRCIRARVLEGFKLVFRVS